MVLKFKTINQDTNINEKVDPYNEKEMIKHSKSEVIDDTYKEKSDVLSKLPKEMDQIPSINTVYSAKSDNQMSDPRQYESQDEVMLKILENKFGKRIDHTNQLKNEVWLAKSGFITSAYLLHPGDQNLHLLTRPIPMEAHIF